MSLNDCKMSFRDTKLNALGAFILLNAFSFVFVESHPVADTPTPSYPTISPVENANYSEKMILIVSIAVPVALVVTCVFITAVICVCCTKNKNEECSTSEFVSSQVDEPGPLMESQTISPEILELLRKAAPPPEERGKRKPFKITADMFTFKGPLRIKIFTNPPKNHALQGTEDVHNFKGDFIFDDTLNEAYEMGWDVEEIQYIYDNTPTKRTAKKAKPFEDSRQTSSSANTKKSKSTHSEVKMSTKSRKSGSNPPTNSVAEQHSSGKG